MKKKSFWSILLFAGMFIVAGVSFNSCEQKSSGGSGGGGSDRDDSKSDTTEYCWEVVWQYNGDTEKDTSYYWITQKEMDEEVKEAKSDSSCITIFSYKKTEAKNQSECSMKDIDPYEKMCWEITYHYPDGQSYTEYAWTYLKEIQDWEKSAARDSIRLTYEETWPYDEEGCEERNGSGGDTTYVQSYYIKHPWDGGSWSWQEMTYNATEDGYMAYGYWGGTGANINTVADDSGADWFPESDIIGAEDVYVGQYVMFVYHHPYYLSVSPAYY